MPVEDLAIIVILALAAVLLVAVVGTLAVAGQALQAYVARLDAPSLSPGDTVWITALGQTRECVVVAVDAEGVALVRPVGPDLT